MKRLVVDLSMMLVLQLCCRQQTDDSGSSADSSDETSTDDTSTDETSTDETSTDDTSTDDTSTPQECRDYEDEQIAQGMVTIVIQNATDQPVFLPTGCDDYLHVVSESGFRWPVWCVTTCEETFRNDCKDCDGCGPSPYRRLDPGGTWNAVWPRELYEFVPLAPQCLGPGTNSCGDPCPIRRRASAESVHIEALAISIQQCQANVTDSSACECDPDSTGSCWVSGPSDNVNPGIIAETTMEPYEQDQVTIMFE